VGEDLAGGLAVDVEYRVMGAGPTSLARAAKEQIPIVLGSAARNQFGFSSSVRALRQRVGVEAVSSSKG
jgi:hypothetical protein